MEQLHPMDAISTFSGQYRFLSNFFASPMEWGEVSGATAEHHYNAAKTLSPQEREKVYAATSPGKAKMAGERVTLQPHWDTTVRYQVMDSILRAKFSDPDLRSRLLATGDALLIEGNNWHDQVWGECECPKHAKWPGQNALGRALMRLRSEIRSDEPDRFVRVALTGHRPQSYTPDQIDWIKRTLLVVAHGLKDRHGTAVAISGMALGADQWWAEAALEAGLSLWSYVPFEAQSERWRPEDRARWQDLRSSASREVVLGTDYDVRLLHCRNDLMIRDCDMMTAVHLKEKRSGGTVDAIKKARERGLPMLRLNVSDREVRRIAAAQLAKVTV